MKGLVFDPARLRRPAWELEHDGYAFAARMLRDDLGVDGRDILAEVRRRARRDPKLREMLLAAAADLALAAVAIEDRPSREGKS